MCEYCGCQQIATIAELTREHDEVVTFVRLVQRALADQRRDDVVTGCRQILDILAPHTVVEEEGLFPEMAQEFPDHISALRSEHREIEKVLGEAAGGFPDDPAGLSERLVGVLSLLRDHILKEQDGVFPAALVALDADQWERIEAVRAKLVAASTASPTSASPTSASPTSASPTSASPTSASPTTASAAATTAPTADETAMRATSIGT